MSSSEVASATTYLPGSLFRYYKEDGTHYTAVLLKDGRVLEVKNPETKEKTKFASLAEWEEVRGCTDDKIQVDTERRPSRTATTEESNVMKYPRNNKTVNRQLRWYYDMMKECNPEMLDNEEIIKSYNALVDVCHKYYNELCPSYHFSRKCYKYSTNLLSNSAYSQWNKWCGFPAEFSSESYYYGTKKSTMNFDEARQEILACYKPFYDLVHKDLHAFMQKKQKEIETLDKIKSYRAKITKTERTIERITRRYAYNLTHYKNRLEELEKSLEN
jgi:hypothetical protein